MTIEIFSSPGCSYCDRAKALLKEHGLEFTEYDLSADDAHREDLIARLPRVRALPQIFIDDEHIGGYDDLALIDEKGELVSRPTG